MARKRWFLSLLVVTIISLGLLAFRSFGKEQKPGKTENTESISEKVDEILKNQQDIIARLEDIRNQQDIIRVRASRK